MDSTAVEVGNQGIISEAFIKWILSGIFGIISFLLGKYFLHDRKKASDMNFVATMEAQKDVLTAQKDALKATIEVQTDALKKDVEATFKNDEKEKESKQGAVELWKDIATEMKEELAILRTEQKLLISQLAEANKTSSSAEGTVIHLREKIKHLEEELDAW
jgi:chromosome segregation ATPase